MSVINECCRSVEGYLNYQVSNIGRVRDTEKMYYLKTTIQKGTGYYVLNLKKDGKQKCVRLHRIIAQEFIANPRNLPLVDHIDGNKTNNSIDNLRWASDKDNQGNRRKQTKPASSQFKCVAWHKSASKWSAQIMTDGKKKHLGLFTNEKEAAARYNHYAVANFGEFAELNEIEDYFLNMILLSLIF